MSKFLNCWLTEASRVLCRLGDRHRELPRPRSSNCSHYLENLAALLIQAGDIAAEQGIDRETWRNLFGQVAQAAAQLLSKTEDTPCEVVSVVLGSKETDAGSLHAGDGHGGAGG